MEKKIDALINMVTQLSLTVNELKNTAPQYPPIPQPKPNHEHVKADKTMRIDVHEFDGTSHDPEVYIKWEKGVERYFEFKDTPPSQQYKIAKVKLTMLAATWLEGLQRQRQRENSSKINTWEKLRKHLRRKYIPHNYRPQLYTSWSHLKQGSRSVSSYSQKGERLIALCGIDEPAEMKVGRFLSGLREDLKDKIEVMQNLTYEGACISALTSEKSAKRKATPLKLEQRPAHTCNKSKDLRQTAQHSSKVGETQQHAPIVKTIHVDNVEINNPPLQASSTCTTLHVDNVEMNGFYFTEDAITHTFHSSFKPPAQKPAQHLPASSSTGSHLPLISTTQPYIASISPYTARQLTAKEKDMNPKDVIPPTKTTQTPTHLLGRKECDAKDDSDRHLTKLTFYETNKLQEILQSISSYKGFKPPSTLLSNFCTIMSTRCIFSVAYYPHTHNQNKIPYETLRNAFKTLIKQNTRDENKKLTHEEVAHNENPHLHFEHFPLVCMYDLNPWNATTLVHLSLQNKGAWNTGKPISTVPHTAAQVQTVANDAASSHVSPYHTSLELRTILFQEGGIEPYQLGSNKDPREPASNNNLRNKTIKNNKEHTSVSVENLDQAALGPVLRTSSLNNDDQDSDQDNDLIMANQATRNTQAKPTTRTKQAKSDQQQGLTPTSDQATLTSPPRCNPSPSDDVEGIIGISTLGTSHHSPRVPRMIIGNSWKLEAKVAQSTWTASSNMHQFLTIEQATLASSPRRDPNPLDDVEHRVGISALGPSHHDPRALLKVNGKALKSEHKVA